MDPLLMGIVSLTVIIFLLTMSLVFLIAFQTMGVEPKARNVTETKKNNQVVLKNANDDIVSRELQAQSELQAQPEYFVTQPGSHIGTNPLLGPLNALGLGLGSPGAGTYNPYVSGYYVARK